MLRLFERSSLRALAAAVDDVLDIDITDADSMCAILEQCCEQAMPLFSLDGRPRENSEPVERTNVSMYQSLMRRPIMNENKSLVLLKYHLQSLRLRTIERELEKVSSRAAKKNLDHLAFLLQLVELEMIERERRAADCRLKAAKFTCHKSLDGFDFTPQATLHKPLVLELMRGGDLDAREHILLVGVSGTGKTHVATALGVARVAKANVFTSSA